MDHLGRDFINLTYEVLLGDGSVINGSCTPNARGDGETDYILAFQANHLGTQILAVYLDGRQLSNSPIRILVITRSCNELHGRISDVSGNCICEPEKYVNVFGTCVAAIELLPSIIIPLVLVIGLAVFSLHVYHRIQAELLWRIKAVDIVLADPEEVLGRGALGVVLKADFRQTPVAVKLFWSSPGSSFAELPFLSQEMHGGALRDSHVDVASTLSLQSSRCASSSSPSSRQVNRVLGANDPVMCAPRSSLQSTSNLFYDQNLTKNVPHMAWQQRASCALPIPTSPSHHSESTDLTRTPISDTSSLPRESGLWSLASSRDKVLEHVKLLVKFRHPCIVTMMGAATSLPAGADGQRYLPLCLVMELMEMGTLQDLLQNRTYPLEAESALHFVQNIARGMSFLHSFPLVHGDLKSSNVLIDRNFTAKISDIALQSKAATGTLQWMAPELLLGGSVCNTTASDVYSFGVVLFECLSRKMPYVGYRDLKQVCQSASCPPCDCNCSLCSNS